MRKKKSKTKLGNQDSRNHSSPDTLHQEGEACSSDRIDFPVVGIGASAGGLEALEGFFSALPNDTNMAFVVVVHLDPNQGSLLPSLLQRHASIPVSEIGGQCKVEPNNIYVIPPNKSLSIQHGSLHLSASKLPSHSRLPIDVFFKSLAQDQNHNAVGIVLSGTGSDGTLGIEAIKAGFGLTMAQDEDSAQYDAMPKSAAATKLVDYILPPSQLPAMLVQYFKRRQSGGQPIVSIQSDITDEALRNIYVLLRARTNHDFSGYKRNTICRRIERRMNVLQLDSILLYVRYLKENEREVRTLFEELLIGVTGFFRDPLAFDALQSKILTEGLKSKPDGYSFRVWIPGCSTGEEAYSIAILLHECMTAANRQIHIQIFGTDIYEAAIETARQGIYPASISADVSADRLKRYFTLLDDGRYQVKKVIREMIVFAQQSIIKDPPFTKLDLLCCRNLLIYLEANLQKRLLPIFNYSLKKDGVLFLGSSETIGQAADLFTVLHQKWKLFGRKNASRIHKTVAELPISASYSGDQNLSAEIFSHNSDGSDTLQLAETILENSATPPSVVINQNNDVVYIHGRTGRFLELPNGRPRMDIVEMARLGLKNILSAGLHKAWQHKKEVVLEDVQVQSIGGPIRIALKLTPIFERSTQQSLMLVVFEEKFQNGDSNSQVTTPAGPGGKSVSELQQELIDTRENLESTIEELETSNEELKSANEELQSTNEELQSTNEELETSKEELQSLNEESVTVNSELQSRIDELTEAHDDMKNLFDSTDIATIFLDSKLSVRRFTPKVTELFPLEAHDVGRPIAHFVSNLVDVDLQELGKSVLKDLLVVEREVVSQGDQSFVMRIRPYRTATNIIDGVVITFQDISDRKKAEKELALAAKKYRMFFDAQRDAVLICDFENGFVLGGNSSVVDLFGVEASSMPGKTMLMLHPDSEKDVISELLGRAKEKGQAENKCKVLRTDGSTLSVVLSVVGVEIEGRSVILNQYRRL